ncbi:MAG TPA: GNAT family N-acetyltransferase [Cyclobacteriaceae bacterium]|nr:GNAT family N-acetyltransferase [Cyclobacteriaceae bacterium]
MSGQVSTAYTTDATDLALLINSAYRGDTSRMGWTTEADLLNGGRTDQADLLEKMSHPGHRFLKYTENGELLGCVYVHADGNRLYLGMLSVKPNWQNKGIGKKLMAASEEQGRLWGCRSVYMLVISERSELVDWYARHGYHETGERRPFHINDIRFGLPKKSLEFIVLEKAL